MGTRIATALIGLSAIVSLALFAPSAPAGPVSGTIPPGLDFWQTSPEDTHADFDSKKGTAIPPGFFGPGSEPFEGRLRLGGVPLRTHPAVGGTLRGSGPGLGDTDTIVRRLEPISPTPEGDQVPIEIVALSLTSVQPITVTFGSGVGPALYEVDVELSPTRGGPPEWSQIFVRDDNTFDSFLVVIPKFTFHKIKGPPQAKDVAEFDFGLIPPGPGDSNLQFHQEGGQWGPECVPPALVVPGYEIFCPGLPPGDPPRKVLTVEESLLAQHGVYPAQEALEHFKCYQTAKKSFAARNVTIQNQFETRNARVSKRKELCNPAKKKSEPFSNRRAHQQCYSMNGNPLNRRVAVQNQFGSQELTVLNAVRLCVPSLKKELPRGSFKTIRASERIDHQACYRVDPVTGVRDSGKGKPRRLLTKDQFRRERVRMGQIKLLCAPTDKNGEGMDHPVDHLACYAIEGKRAGRRVKIRNQFERTRLKVPRPSMFCVPSNKIKIAPG